MELHTSLSTLKAQGNSDAFDVPMLARTAADEIRRLAALPSGPSPQAIEAALKIYEGPRWPEYDGTDKVADLAGMEAALKAAYAVDGVSPTPDGPPPEGP